MVFLPAAYFVRRRTQSLQIEEVLVHCGGNFSFAIAKQHQPLGHEFWASDADRRLLAQEPLCYFALSFSEWAQIKSDCGFIFCAGCSPRKFTVVHVPM